jgi:thiamine-phosphate pyrophosphorylase
VKFPTLYPILDAGFIEARGLDLHLVAEQMRVSGVSLIQYRDKAGSPQTILRNAAMIRKEFAGTDCKLILNDRADLAALAAWSGVHVGQGDLLPEDARRIVGAGRWVGVSTHNDEQVRQAERSSADYVAVGPVFATGTKADAEPVIGLDGVRRARALTRKPIVAIGGITWSNARSVMEAGADSVAVISALFVEDRPAGKVARDFLDLLG